MKGERWKLRVSESREKVHFYYAERKQVQAHKVRLKRKGLLASREYKCKHYNIAELAQLVEQLIRPMINKEVWGKGKAERGKRKGKSGKLRISESREKVHFYYAERKQVQAHKVRLKRKGLLASREYKCKHYNIAELAQLVEQLIRNE